MENDLETLNQIYYEKYANKNSTNSSSTPNIEFSSGVSSASYAVQFLSPKKQKCVFQSFVNSISIEKQNGKAD